jgi:hypothetical protein
MFANVSYPYNGTVQSLIKSGSYATYNYYPLGSGYTGPTTYNIDYTVNRNFINTSEKKEIQFNNINSNNATITNGTITNATITNSSINKISGNTLLEGRIKTRSLLPGYIIDGVNNFFTYPILCSMKGCRPADTDDLYYINPGYKFQIYPNDNYSGTSYSLDNDGTEPVVKQALSVNTLGSIKVFYRNSSSDAYTEITMSYLS